MADCSIARMLAAVSGASQIRRYVRTIRMPMIGILVGTTPVSAATSTSGSMIRRRDSRNNSSFEPNRYSTIDGSTCASWAIARSVVFS